MRKTSHLLVALLVAVTIGAGCQSIPTDRQLSTFAATTSLVATVARDTLASANNAVVTRKLRERAELGDGVDDALFTPLVADDAYAARIEFLDALDRYATALDELASADRTKAMDKALTKVAGALDALGKHYESITGKKEPSVRGGAVKQLVNVIGGEVTQAARREGIRRAVAIQHDVMQDVLPVLRDEVGPAGIFGIAHRNQVEGEKATLMSRYNTDHKQDQLSKNPDTRLKRLKRVQEAWAKATAVKKLYGRPARRNRPTHHRGTGALRRDHRNRGPRTPLRSGGACGRRSAGREPHPQTTEGLGP